MNVFIKEQSIRTCKSKFKGYTWQKLQDLALSSFLSSYLIPSDHASSLSIHVNPATNKTISERCIFLKEKNHKSKWTIHHTPHNRRLRYLSPWKEKLSFQKMNDPRNLPFHRSNTFDLTITTVTLSNSNTESRITFPSFPNCTITTGMITGLDRFQKIKQSILEIQVRFSWSTTVDSRTRNTLHNFDLNRLTQIQL